MKLELPISSNYVPSWGVFEGCREIIQNAKDAETEHNAAFDMDYCPHKQRLRVRTTGATIDRKALILGFTSKRGREDLIGEHGEGLALGILALCRAHISVKLALQDEVWKPYMSFSEKWGEVVLSFDVTKTKTHKDPRVWVEICGITQEQMSALRERILWLPGNDLLLSASHVVGATILRSEQHSGCIYAKGIFIQKIDGFRFGYNFDSIRVDRDRGMADTWDSKWNSSSAIAKAVEHKSVSITDLFDLCDAVTEDTQYLEHHIGHLSNTTRQEIANYWLGLCGDTAAIPVASTSDLIELESFGLYGRIVPNTGLRIVLQTALKRTKESAIAEKGNAIAHIYSLDELNSQRRDNFETALSLLRQAGVCEDEPIQIVSFHKEDILGLYKKDQGCMISVRVLDVLSQTIATIVHELAHYKSECGDESHLFRQQQEKHWTMLMDVLLPKVQEKETMRVSSVAPWIEDLACDECSA